MAESRAIHQIEYRWQQAKDMSAVATSMSPASFESWVARIGAWVRHPGVDAPAESVRYEEFDDQSAALAWRQRDRRAAGFTGGRPLASRVLVGPADLLTPDVAIAVCYTGLLPDMVGPLPGMVSPGDPLPTVDVNWLTKLLQDNFEALDRRAASEPGLDRVVAAALGDLETPLSVELPERCINQSPRGGSQALLLWGLLTTVGPLLGRGWRRGWSFSTFELPLTDMDPGTLPDIVFRLSQPAPPTAPMATRPEIRVRPQDPIAPPVETVPQQLAKLLVIAYADHDPEEFNRLIMTYAGDHQSTDQRIQVVYQALAASLSPVVTVTEGPATATIQIPVKDQPVKDRPDEGTLVTSAVSSQTTGPGPVSPPAPVATPPAVSPAVSPGGSGWEAPGPLAGGSQPSQAEETAQPETLSGLLAVLSARPAARQFEAAMRALTAQNFRTGPQDRATARRLIRDHRWYLEVFGQHDQAEREAILVGLFWNCVIPDLADEQVLDELTYWAGTLAAPDTVINALYQATEGAAGAQPQVNRALVPALALRWLSEHRIHVPLAVPAPGQGTVAGSREQGGLQRALVPPIPQPVGPQEATGPQAAAQPTAAPRPAQPTADWQTLLHLMEGKWNVPVPIVLAVGIVLVVLLIVR